MQPTSLLSRLQMAPSQVETAVRQALSRDYWRALNPQLSVESDAPRQMEAAGVTLQEVDGCIAGLGHEGYFQLSPAARCRCGKQMRSAIENLCAHDWLSRLQLHVRTSSGR